MRRKSERFAVDTVVDAPGAAGTVAAACPAGGGSADTVAPGLPFGELTQPARMSSTLESASVTVTLKRFENWNTRYVVAISRGWPCAGPPGVYCLVDDVLGQRRR